MRIEQLEYFLTIARYGSISQAANNLYIGQPTLSATLSALERELDTKLFRRTKTGMELTPMGKELLPLTEKAVDAFYLIKKKATEKVITKHTIHLTCDPSTSGTVIVDIVGKCKRRYPSVTLHIHEVLPSEVIRNVVEGKATIGLSATEDHAIAKHQEYANNLNLILQPLYTDQICLCCQPTHPLAQENAVSFLSLVEQPMAIYEGFIQQGMFKQVNAYQNFSKLCGFSNYENIKKAIIQDNMVAIMPKRATLNDLYFQEGLIVSRKLTDHSTNLIHYLTYCQEHPLSEVEKDLLHFIHDYYDRMDNLPAEV